MIEDAKTKKLKKGYIIGAFGTKAIPSKSKKAKASLPLDFSPSAVNKSNGKPV